MGRARCAVGSEAARMMASVSTACYLLVCRVCARDVCTCEFRECAREMCAHCHSLGRKSPSGFTLQKAQISFVALRCAMGCRWGLSPRRPRRPDPIKRLYQHPYTPLTLASALVSIVLPSVYVALWKNSPTLSKSLTVTVGPDVHVE